jgi:hypothetical protein
MLRAFEEQSSFEWAALQRVPVVTAQFFADDVG